MRDGGLKTAKDALNWLILMKELGTRVMMPDLFRIDASSMLAISRGSSSALPAVIRSPTATRWLKVKPMASIKDIMQPLECGPAPSRKGGRSGLKARHLTMTLHEPWRTMGIVAADAAPLLLSAPTQSLAEQDEVSILWRCGSAEGSAMVERASAGNLKSTWVDYGRRRDWRDPKQGQGTEFLRRACQPKTLWGPYGE